MCETKSSQYFVGALGSGRETWAFYMLPLPTHSSHDPAPRCELRISRNSVWLSIKNWLLLPKLTPRLVNQMPVCSFKMRDLLLPRDPGCIFPPAGCPGANGAHRADFQQALENSWCSINICQVEFNITRVKTFSFFYFFLNLNHF